MLEKVMVLLKVFRMLLYFFALFGQYETPPCPEIQLRQNFPMRNSGQGVLGVNARLNLLFCELLNCL